MAKKKTISTRWRDWIETPGEFWWGYTTLVSFCGSILSLGFHLGILHGFWRQVGLIAMIVLAAWTQTALGLRKQWWWFTFHLYIVLGVIGWEIASFFFGS